MIFMVDHQTKLAQTFLLLKSFTGVDASARDKSVNMVTFDSMNRIAVMPGLFRQRKPRQFHYKPLFYDPKKEAREERLKKIRDAAGKDEPLPYVPSLRKGSFHAYHGTYRRNTHTRSNARLFVIILLLGLIAYFLLLS
jgi:hypothetical protein